MTTRRIIKDYARPYTYGKGRRFDFRHLAKHLTLPIGVSALVASYGADFSDAMPSVITVFSIMTALMTTLLMLVFNLADRFQARRRYERREAGKFEEDARRLEVLDMLYNTACASVIALVFATILSIVVYVAPPSALRVSTKTWQLAGIVEVYQRLSSAIIAFVLAFIPLTFVVVVGQMYDLIVRQISEMQEDLYSRHPHLLDDNEHDDP